jgi:hypothetical protein
VNSPHGTDQLDPDRLERAIHLLETVRAMCIFILIGFFVGTVLIYINYDNIRRNRAIILELKPEIENVRADADRMQRAVDQFNDGRVDFVASHERTQRLICYHLRMMREPLPDNGDCDGR